MPFRKWKVEPVFLSRKPLPPDKPIFETTTNGTLVKCMEQMASLLTLADRIFEEIGAECRLVLERTEKLKVKVKICVDAVARLDAKAVTVPISDLENTVLLLRRPQYVTHFDQTNQLFLPSTRPPSVDELYGKASATPVPLISAIDRYRSDGRKGSQLFMVTPILGDAERRRKKHRKMLDIETRRPASFALAKDWQEDDENGTFLSESGLAVASSSSSTLQQRIRDNGLERLPSPEELALAASLEYPSSVVPVDTTGSSFLRMIKSRRSLIHDSTTETMSVICAVKETAFAFCLACDAAGVMSTSYVVSVFSSIFALCSVVFLTPVKTKPVKVVLTPPSPWELNDTSQKCVP